MAAKKKIKKKQTKSKRAAGKKVMPTKKLDKKRGIPKKKSARKEPAPKKAAVKTKAVRNKTIGARTVSALKKQVPEKNQSVDTVAFPTEGREASSGRQSGDLQGLSSVAGADSESVDELLEEGNAFESDVVKGVEDAGKLIRKKSARMRCRRMMFPANIWIKSSGCLAFCTPTSGSRRHTSDDELPVRTGRPQYGHDRSEFAHNPYPLRPIGVCERHNIVYGRWELKRKFQVRCLGARFRMSDRRRYENHSTGFVVNRTSGVLLHDADRSGRGSACKIQSGQARGPSTTNADAEAGARNDQINQGDRRELESNRKARA